MENVSNEAIAELCRAYDNDRTRLLDILREVQNRAGYISPEAVSSLAACLGVPEAEVAGTASFYAHFSRRKLGKVVIRLCDDVVDEMFGAARVAAAFQEALGIPFDSTTPDGLITLKRTPCIGMSDQAPAALINEVVVTRLSSDSAREIVEALRKHGDPAKLVRTLGDGNNAHPLVRAMVQNNIRTRGPVIFDPLEPGEAVRRALSMTPAEVIRGIKTARLRGRGGAGFPTGMKWEFARQAPGARKFIFCNADEGEPGTFKDRVILTEQPDLLFEGMTIAAYAVGAQEGIVYLRSEYAYLRRFLEHVLQKRRDAGLLGEGICGKPDFSFDIRIQLGAIAYVCGEETALLNSAEGKRGDPRNKPPFPAQHGFLGQPTVVNNVETFCCAARIMQRGAAWFAALGSRGSSGTKLLSVCGDCQRPGVYEVPFGIVLGELLELVGAEDPQAVQVGGPSGAMVGPSAFHRTICYDDLATGGSIIVLNGNRSILHVVKKFLDFFVEESCGYCTPCRVGNVLMRDCVQRIIEGKAGPEDLAYLEQLCRTVKAASRCGLGQTSANPILTSLEHFRSEYERKLKKGTGVRRPSFDLAAALKTAREVQRPVKKAGD